MTCSESSAWGNEGWPVCQPGAAWQHSRALKWNVPRRRLYPRRQITIHWGDDLRDYRDRPELRRSEQEDLQRLSHFRLSFTQQVRLPWAFLNAYFNNSFFLDRDAARYSRLTWTGNWSSPSTPLWCSSPPAWTASCSPPPCPWTWTPSYPSTRSISIWTTEQH